MRYLINIIGPQAVGKTTVIEELKEYLADYRVLAIDDFRRQYDSSTPEGEMRAWTELLRYATSSRKVIIESSGTSNNLLHVIAGMSAYGSIEMYNIFLTANQKTIDIRKQKRGMRGYVSPPMYFTASNPFSRKHVIPVMAPINTECRQPYEIAAHIIDLLPSEFV